VRKYRDHTKTSSLPEQISEQQLLAYLQGKLAPKEQYAIELLLQEDEFLNDAVEGLQHVQDPQSIEQMTVQLNLLLRRQIRERNSSRRLKRRTKPDRQLWLYIMIVLIFVVVAYAVYRIAVGS
jgi:anti-sigma factor RsiW